MSRTSDITIFGATGFTGQRVVAEAVRSLPQQLRQVKQAMGCSSSICLHNAMQPVQH
jgi:short subunit dehydrogenase-like uncharacterized protein